MKAIRWSSEKNAKLKRERNVSFEAVLVAIERGDILDDVAHPNPERYGNQRMMIVVVQDYAWLVPYVETGSEIFLKTIIPSRKATKRYL